MSFSVLMSIYSKSSLIHFKECLHSLNNQTLLPDQVVIVQDGDLNYEINDVLNKYNNLTFDVLRNKINKGLPNSLNLGLELCKFDIVFRMDADDICDKNRFKIQYNLMINSPEISVLGSNVLLIDGNSNLIDKKRYVPLTDKRIRKMMILKNTFNHPSVVFRKSVINLVGNYSNVAFYEDWFLWLKLKKLPNVVFSNINDNLLYYRIRSFDERSGLAIIKLELNFYLLLLNEKMIDFLSFVFLITIKSIIRIFPKNIYLLFKHKFDRIK